MTDPRMKPGQDFMDLAVELFRRTPVAADSTSRALEVVPWCLYSTAEYISESTVQLDFFRCLEPHQETNLYIPSMLPEPQSFLVQSMHLRGFLSSEPLALGGFEFWIANKIYAKFPAWVGRMGYPVYPNLFMAPSTHFGAKITWPADIRLTDRWGIPQDRRKIQLAFLGQLARPLQ